MKQACVSIAILGGVMLIAGLAWGFIFPPEKSWTEAKAMERSKLQEELHILHMQVVQLRRGSTKLIGDKEPGDIEQRYRQAKERLDAMNGEFDQIAGSPIPTILRFGGMFTLLGGLVGLRALESS